MGVNNMILSTLFLMTFWPLCRELTTPFIIEQIVELNLDNCRATNIEGLTDEFTNLESLSLINVGLTTLKGFPKLPNLRKVSYSKWKAKCFMIAVSWSQ